MIFIKPFLKENCLLHESVLVPKKLFFKVYHDWCLTTDSFEYSNEDLCRILEALNVFSILRFYGTLKKKTIFLRGVTLLDWWDENKGKIYIYGRRNKRSR